MTTLEKSKDLGTEQPELQEELAGIIGRNLRKIRTRRGLTLEKLAKLASVSRGMLSQIEQGKSVPTILLLWKVAKALDVPFSALHAGNDTTGSMLMPLSSAKFLSSQDGKFISRALFPINNDKHEVEFYELELKPGAFENAVPHAEGTLENLVVGEGEIEITVDHQKHRLKKRDAIIFSADVPHSYRNTSQTNSAFIYLVIIYSKS